MVTKRELVSGDVRLIIAIFDSAFKDKDIVYFQNDLFKLHCKLLNLNYKYIHRKYMEKL